jgi:hemolysin D
MTFTSTSPIASRNTEGNARFLQQMAQPGLLPERATQKPPAQPAAEAFDHPLLVRQPQTWSRGLLWCLLTAITGGITWANMAEIEEAIPAQGKLEPQGTVKTVQAPNQGVVKAVYVKEGQKVKKGDRLVKFDPTAMTAQINSLQQVRRALEQENSYYAAQLDGFSSMQVPHRVSLAIVSLSRNRVAVLKENEYLRAQLSGNLAGLSVDQQARLKYKEMEETSRTQTAQLQAQQLQRQMEQSNVKSQTAQKTLAMNQGILNKVQPLADEGAISQVQLLKQKQEVEANRSEVDQLAQEHQRLMLAVDEISAKARNSDAVYGRDVMAQISVNEQKIAEIDSQFTKAILENQKRISEIDGQLQQTQQLLKYSEIKSPADGVIFDMKARAPGFVANAAEPLLQVVPQEALVAKVAITNQDIGFVRPGMEVDVRVDSFPFSEFGDIKGELTWIGSDANEPTQLQPQYTFPAKVKLKNQKVMVKGKEVKLHSGMSLSVNIKTRKRKVIDIFTEQFKKGAESLKFVR